MISRRNIRVKVMQTLYSLTTLEKADQASRSTVARMLNEKLDQVLDVFTVCVMYPIQVAQYAESDSLQRSSRYIRTEEDMNVSTRIATNSYITKLLSKASFTEKIKKDNLDRYIDQDWIKKLYGQLLKSEEYNIYINLDQPTEAQDKNIVQYIWDKLIVTNESVLSTFNDDLPGWEDNSELIVMLMENFFKNSSRVDFNKLLSAEKKNYAHDLLLAVIEKEEYCLELIQPKLTNWDKERVALIDMLLLRMAVCEFLYFPTIPTKVTINEFIDIAKQYSLPQSGQFVNGVLDNLLKELEKEDKIRKQDRIAK